MPNGENIEARLERIERLLAALLERELPYRDPHIAQMLLPGEQTQLDAWRKKVGPQKFSVI